MKIFVLTIPPHESYGDTVTMVVVQAPTIGKVESLMREWNSDEEIRSSGGCPIDMCPFDEYQIQIVGTALESETEPKILNYTYTR